MSFFKMGQCVTLTLIVKSVIVLVPIRAYEFINNRKANR